MSEGKELFSTLHVQIHTCNPGIRDLQGTSYKDYPKKTLRGKDAYLFLVQLNAFDKRLYNEPLHPDARYADITDFSLSYQGISAYPSQGKGNFLHHIKVNASKGTLSFNGATNVADMINIRAFWFPNVLVKDSPYVRNLLRRLFHKESFLDDMDSIRESAHDELEALNQTFLEPFRKEEEAYLLKYPEIRAINEIKVEPYIYICDTQKFEDGINLLSYNIVQDSEMKNYLAFPVQDVTTILRHLATNEATASEVDARYLKPRHGIPKSMTAFYAYIHPQKMQNEDVLLCVPSSILETMKTLREMTYCVITQEDMSKDIPADATIDWRVSGVQIFHALQKIFDTDYNRYRDTLLSGINVSSEKIFVKRVLLYRNEPALTTYIWLGAGAHARRVMEKGLLDASLIVYSRHPESDPVGKERIALNLYLRYTDFLTPYEGKDGRILQQAHPSVEESQQNWLKNAASLEPPIQEARTDDYYLSCYKAFRRYALIFQTTNKTEAFIWRMAVQRMLASGHTREQIQAFATWCLEQYDTAVGTAIQDALKELETESDSQSS